MSLEIDKCLIRLRKHISGGPKGGGVTIPRVQSRLDDLRDVRAYIRELKVEIKKLKEANRDAMGRLVSSADIASRNILLRTQRDCLLRVVQEAEELIADIIRSTGGNLIVQNYRRLNETPVELRSIITACKRSAHEKIPDPDQAGNSESGKGT